MAIWNFAGVVYPFWFLAAVSMDDRVAWSDLIGDRDQWILVLEQKEIKERP